MGKMTRINDNVYSFTGVFDLDTYAAKKYGKQANCFGYYKVDGTEGMRVCAVSFNNPQEIDISIDMGEYGILSRQKYISITDLKMHPAEMCAVLGALNVKKYKMLENLQCHYDGKHIFIISDAKFDNIELGIVLINKEKVPNYMDILFHLTSDPEVAVRFLMEENKI